MPDAAESSPIPNPETVREAFVRLGESLRPLIEEQILGLWAWLLPQVEASAAVVRSLCAWLAENPDLLQPDYGPDTGPCHHACWQPPEHECTGEGVTALAYRPGGRLVPMCAPCRDVVLAARKAVAA